MTILAKPDTRCKWCGKHFTRSNSFRTVCSWDCVEGVAKQTERDAKKRTKAERAALKLALINMRPRSRWLDDTQKAVNAYIRARDRYKPCISCGCPWEPSFQAGHYLSRGARPELRFDLDNIHGQCVRDNMHLHGNQAMYRVGLVERHGLACVERLEGPHPPAKWSIDELKTMRDAFRILTKQALESQSN